MHLVVVLPGVGLASIWLLGGTVLLDVDRGGTAALVSLGGENHVVVSSELQAAGCPGLEVVASGDVATNTASLADRPELIESCLADN
jgi:hypothetical protein